MQHNSSWHGALAPLNIFSWRGLGSEAKGQDDAKAKGTNVWKNFIMEKFLSLVVLVILLRWELLWNAECLATLYMGVSHLTLSQSISLQEEAEARNATKSTTIIYTSVLLGNHSATSTTSCFCLAWKNKRVLIENYSFDLWRDEIHFTFHLFPFSDFLVYNGCLRLRVSTVPG